MSYKIIVPFGGFYESIHDSIIENYVSIIYGEEALERASDKSWRRLQEEYCKQWLGEFNDRYGINIKYESLICPNAYNYSTDEIFADISEDDLSKLIEQAKQIEGYDEYLKQVTTSRDGYLSLYSYDEIWEDENKDILAEHTIRFLLQQEPLWVEDFETDIEVTFIMGI